MIERSALYERWNRIHALKTQNSQQIISYQGFYSCKFGSTFIGLDAVGNESLYISVDNVFENIFVSPDISGLSFEIVLVLTLSEKNKFLKIEVTPGHSALNEAFEAFTVTLISRISLIDDFVSLSDAIFEACNEYSTFFGKGAKTSLSFIEEEGLFGELIVLKECLERFGDHSISCWTGPTKNRHDFMFQDKRALEVKTSLKQNRKLITVSNDTQLSNIENAPLFLAFLILEADPKGLSIADLVNTIYDQIKNREVKEDFQRKLLEMKVVRSQISTKRRFSLVKRHWYKVDNQFPKLTLDEIHSISNRIYDVKYKIDLDGLDEYKGDVYDSLRV